MACAAALVGAAQLPQVAAAAVRPATALGPEAALATAACPTGPTEAYPTGAGSLEAAFPARPTVVVGDASTLEGDSADVATFWQTFAGASRYTYGPVVVVQYALARDAYCDAGVAVARVRPGDQARLAKLLSGQLNFRFSVVAGADVGAGPPAMGPSPADDALGLTPTELVAAAAVEPTPRRSEGFVASVSADGLATGALAAATPGAARTSGTLTGTAGACMGIVPKKYSTVVTVVLQRGNAVVADQLVTDTSSGDQPYEFFEPGGHYTVSATPGPHAAVSVDIEAGKTTRARVASSCL